MPISIIVPVFNEEQQIPLLFAHLQRFSEAEILVVDGGSRDRTREYVQREGGRLLSSPPGRGRQQNVGAWAASGDILLFLHCDTRLPEAGSAGCWPNLILPQALSAWSSMPPVLVTG